MTVADVHAKMRLSPIFTDTNPQKLNEYITLDSVAVREFSAQDEILSPLTKEIPLGIVLCGKVSVFSANGSDKVILKSLTEGEFFGIATLYAPESDYPSRICAKTHCRILFVSPSAVRSLIENDPQTAKAFISLLSRKIVYLNKKISSFTAGSTERKLVTYLADNSKEDCCALSVPMSSLASMLDIGRASLYRALDKLESEGFIKKQGRSIIITDRQAMLNRYSSQTNSAEL